LERGQLMSAVGTIIDGKPRVRPGFFGEHPQELDNVVSRYLPMFYKRAFQFLGNATDAEDAVQDALLSAYKHLGQFRGQAQLSTWLTTIVTNAARMQLRRRRGSHLSLDEQQGEDGLTLSERLPDSRPDQEEVCSAAELHNRLANGVKQLSPTLRRAFELRHVEGLTPKEAARVLGVPEGTVKAQLARARIKLAGIMKVTLSGRRSRRSLAG
jgi:RNA polymerase sigma-70 factor, ECF subfamily